MKTFLQAAGIFILIVLTITFMANKFSSATSDTELQNSLDAAVEHALYVAMTDNVYTIDNTEYDFEAQFSHFEKGETFVYYAGETSSNIEDMSSEAQTSSEQSSKDETSKPVASNVIVSSYPISFIYLKNLSKST